MFQLSEKTQKTRIHRAIGVAWMNARNSSAKYKVGASIYCKSRLVSMGYNKMKTHPKSKKRGRHIHAELDALIRSDMDVTGCDIFVARVSKSGRRANAKPCKDCQDLLKDYGIRRAYFTVDHNLVDCIDLRKGEKQ